MCPILYVRAAINVRILLSPLWEGREEFLSGWWQSGDYPETGLWEITHDVDWFLPIASEVTTIYLTTLRRRTECSGEIQLIEKFEVGSPGRI